MTCLKKDVEELPYLSDPLKFLPAVRGQLFHTALVSEGSVPAEFRCTDVLLSP